METILTQIEIEALLKGITEGEKVTRDASAIGKKAGEVFSQNLEKAVAASSIGSEVSTKLKDISSSFSQKLDIKPTFRNMFSETVKNMFPGGTSIFGEKLQQQSKELKNSLSNALTTLTAPGSAPVATAEAIGKSWSKVSEVLETNSKSVKSLANTYSLVKEAAVAASDTTVKSYSSESFNKIRAALGNAITGVKDFDKAISELERKLDKSLTAQAIRWEKYYKDRDASRKQYTREEIDKLKLAQEVAQAGPLPKRGATMLSPEWSPAKPVIGKGDAGWLKSMATQIIDPTQIQAFETQFITSFRKIEAQIVAYRQRLEELRSTKGTAFLGDESLYKAAITNYEQLISKLEKYKSVLMGMPAIEAQWTSSINQRAVRLINERFVGQRVQAARENPAGVPSIPSIAPPSFEKKVSNVYASTVADEEKRIMRLKAVEAQIKAVGQRIGELKKIPPDTFGNPQVLESLITHYKKLHSTLNMEFHGMEGNRLSVRNFSLSLGILKKDMMDLVMWQARWYGSKALLFAPLQGAAQGVKDFISWEQAMKNVAAVSDASAENIKKLEDATISVGNTTPISAEKAAKAMLEFAQAGVDVNTIQKALPVSAKMVVATQEDMSTAVSALTTIYNVWTEDAKDMETVGGKLAASMAESKLKVADLSTVFNYLATSSNLAGISLSDTLTMVTAMSQAGVKASTIGTGLGNFISRMTTIKGEWKKTLESKGLNIAELTLPENNMIEVLKKLKAAGIDVVDLFKGLEMRAGRTAGALLTMVDRLDDISSKINQPGILEKMFGKSMEGIDNQLSVIKNKIQGLFINLGRDSVGGINALVKSLNSLVDILVSLKTEIQMVGYALAIRLGVGAIGAVIANMKELIKWFKAFKWELLGLVSEKWWITIGITFVIWFNAKMQETMDKEKVKIRDYVEKLSRDEAQTLKEAIESKGNTPIPFEGIKDKDKKEKLKKALKDYYEAGGTRYGTKDIEDALSHAMSPEIESHTPSTTDTKRDRTAPSKAKTYREELALAEKQRRDELSLIKSKLDLETAYIENAKKNNYLTEEEFYDKKRELIIENFDAEIQVAKDTYNEFAEGGKVRQEYLDTLGKEKDAEKQRQLTANYNINLREAEIKVMILQNQKAKELANAYGEEEVRLRSLNNEYFKGIFEIGKLDLEKGLNASKHAMEMMATAAEYLYGKMDMSSKEYYSLEKNRIATNLANTKASIEYDRKAKLDNATNTISDEILRTQAVKKINEESDEAIRAAERESQKESLNSYLKYLEDLKRIFEESGISGVVSKVATDMSKQFGDVASNIKASFETVMNTLESELEGIFDGLMEGTLDWQKAVSNVLKTMAKEIIKTFAIKPLMSGLTGVIGEKLKPKEGEEPSWLSKAFGFSTKEATGTSQEKTATYTEQTATNTKDILNELRGGSLLGEKGTAANPFSESGITGTGKKTAGLDDAFNNYLGDLDTQMEEVSVATESCFSQFFSQIFGFIKKIGSMIQGMFSDGFGLGEGRGLDATDFALQDFMPIEGRASGGKVSLNKSYLIGERGPELFTPGSNGNITPNNKLFGGQSNTTVNVINQTSTPVDAKKSEVKFDGEKYVVNVVLKELTQNYGPLRHAVSGIRGR